MVIIEIFFTENEQVKITDTNLLNFWNTWILCEALNNKKYYTL